jgi:hypothetical protein
LINATAFIRAAARRLLQKVNVITNGARAIADRHEKG